MEKHPIENIMNSTLSNMKDMINVDTIIGAPFTAGDATIIPISKLCFGFVSGGGEYADSSNNKPTKNQDEENSYPFAGGTGAGVGITPAAFLVIYQGKARLLPVQESTIYDRLLDLAPQVVDELKNIINCDNKRKDNEDVQRKMDPDEEL